MIECFLIDIDSVDVMAPFCLELEKRGVECNLALDELFWKVSYGEHFDINKAIQKAKEYSVKLNLQLNYNAKIAVTQWTSDWALFGLYKNYKARLSYGANVREDTIFYDYNFDLYFVYGDFEKEVLLKKGIDEKRIIKIGYPKLLYQKEKKLNSKEILTYLPTWDEYSAIDWILEKFKNLNYEIWIKPHPLTFLVPDKKHILEKIKKYGFKIVNYSTKTIVKNSDVIVTDLKSGVTWDILFFDPQKTLIVAYNKKDKNGYFNFFDKFDLAINEDDEFSIPASKDKTKLKNYIFEQNPEYEKIKSFNLPKISKTIKKNELDILQERLEKTYNFLRKNNDKNK